MKKSARLEHGGEDRRRRSETTSDRELLSPREREVMTLAATGLANKQIAQQLKVAEGTVKLHLHRVYRKLGIKSRFALAFLRRSSHQREPGDPSDAA